jgi:putative membrane protein
MKIQKTTLVTMAAGMALLLSSGGLLAADREASEQRGQLSEKDYKFVLNAARGGMMEAQAGELAKQKGASEAVRNFGERMTTDHGKANTELKDIVTRKGATLPTTMSHGENSTMNKLEKETGADFDKTFASAMVKDHKKDLKEFQDAAKDVTDPDLKAFAQKTAGIIEEHLRMAQDMENTVKGEKNK